MQSATKTKVECDAATADDGAVRLGDSSLYFDPAADQRVKTPPAEIADDGNVRMGDGGLYFDPAADQAAKSIETVETK
jgi:hypothetical protein